MDNRIPILRHARGRHDKKMLFHRNMLWALIWTAKLYCKWFYLVHKTYFLRQILYLISYEVRFSHSKITVSMKTCFVYSAIWCVPCYMMFTKIILIVKIPPERRNLEFRDCFKRENHLLRPYRYGERNYPQITWISAYCNVPYFFGYKREFSSLPKQFQKSRSIL